MWELVVEVGYQEYRECVVIQRYDGDLCICPKLFELVNVELGTRYGGSRPSITHLSIVSIHDRRSNAK